MSVLGLKPDEERRIADGIWRELIAGKSEEEICSSLGVDPDSFARFRALAFDRGTESIREQPQEYVYADYLVRQSRCIRELDQMVASWAIRDEDSRVKVSQPGAYVSAVRTKSEIIDRILTTGRELGMIRVEEGTSVPGLNLKDMSNKEVQGQIVRELKNLERLERKFGVADIADHSLEPSKIYLDEKVPASSAGLKK